MIDSVESKNTQTLELVADYSIKLSTIASAIGIFALIVAGVYEVAFFVGFDFSSIEYVSISDLFRRAMLLLPIIMVLSLFVLGLTHVMISEYAPRFQMSREELPRSEFFRILAAKVIVVLFFSYNLIVILLFSPLRPTSIMLGGIFVYFGFLVFSKKWTSFYRRGPIWTNGFVLIFAIFLSGWDAGRIPYITSKFDTVVINSVATREVVAVRKLDKGALFLTKDRRILFVPWDDLKEVSKDGIYINEESIYGRIKRKLRKIGILRSN